nr:MAG TPA: 60S ribosomal subunit [Caudoviricetes sp.]
MTNQDLSIRNDAGVFLFCNKCLTYDSKCAAAFAIE